MDNYLQNVFETTHPGTVELETTKSYSITGLVNGQPKFFSYPKAGKMKVQIPMINPGKTQSVIEIWSSNETMEPKFASNWRNLQFIFVKNCTYHGVTDLNSMSRFSKARRVHVFRLSTKRAPHRYIWLSQDSSEFWKNPVSNFDDVVNFEREQVFLSMILNKCAFLLKIFSGDFFLLSFVMGNCVGAKF